MATGFSEMNRARRERNAFRNLVEYAKATDIPDAEKAAEQAAAEIHGGKPSASRPARKPKPKPKAAPKPAAKATPKAAPKAAAKPAAKAAAKSEPKKKEVPRSLEDRTKEQLYARAQELDIEGRSQMSKDELIEAIRKK